MQLYSINRPSQKILKSYHAFMYDSIPYFPQTLRGFHFRFTDRSGCLVMISDYMINPPILIYPTPPLGQDMTQGQFLSGV